MRTLFVAMRTLFAQNCSDSREASGHVVNTGLRKETVLMNIMILSNV